MFKVMTDAVPAEIAQQLHPLVQLRLPAILRQLVSHGADKIIIFGSSTDMYTFSQDSDIDIAVIGGEFSAEGLTLSREIKMPVDMLVYPDEDSLLNCSEYSIEKSILRGVVIYGG